MDNKMDNKNIFIGVLGLDGKLFLQLGINEYYTASLLCGDARIPVLMPRTAYELYTGKRISMIAFPRITRKKVNEHKEVFAYLSCVDVEETDEPHDTRYVKIYGRVITHLNPKINSKRNYVHFELEYWVDVGKPIKVLVPCRAFGGTARKLQTLDKGSYLTVSGYISGDDSVLRIVVKHFEEGKRTPQFFT